MTKTGFHSSAARRDHCLWWLFPYNPLVLRLRKLQRPLFITMSFMTTSIQCAFLMTRSTSNIYLHICTCYKSAGSSCRRLSSHWRESQDCPEMMHNIRVQIEPETITITVRKAFHNTPSSNTQLTTDSEAFVEHLAWAEITFILLPRVFSPRPYYHTKCRPVYGSF